MESLIGYARTASGLQGSTQESASLARQRAALAAAGCESVFEESCSGMLPRADRTGLTQVLGRLQAGDTLMVCDMTRLSRSPLCLAMVLSDLQKRGVKLHVLDRPSEFTNLVQVLDQGSHDFDDLKGLDHSRRIKRGIALAKKAREQAA